MKMQSSTPVSSSLAHMLLQLKDGSQQQQQDKLSSIHEKEMKSSSFVNLDHNLNGERETCHCKKSRCLKLYCQCFAVSAFCSSGCRCLQCENTENFIEQRQEAIRQILDRNPIAFDSKFKPAKQAAADVNTDNLYHKIGCRCRKSMCLKKYCECYQADVKCSAACTCLHCCNGNASRKADQPQALPIAIGLPRSSLSALSSDMYEAYNAPHGDLMMKAVENLGQLRTQSKHFTADSESPTTSPEDVSSQPSSLSSSFNAFDFIIGNSSSPTATVSKPPIPHGKPQQDRVIVSSAPQSMFGIVGMKRKIIESYSKQNPSDGLVTPMKGTKNKDVDSNLVHIQAETERDEEYILKRRDWESNNSIRSASPNSVNIANALSQLSKNVV